MMNIFSKTNFSINEMQDAVEAMVEITSIKGLAEEVEHINMLINFAEMDAEAFRNYEEAVKAVAGDAWRDDIFANEHHRRLCAKALDSLTFAAKEVCMHNSLVHKKTGKYILSRRYDVSKQKEAQECVEEFKMYATLVATECYLQLAVNK